jgi:hypothetical protein
LLYRNAKLSQQGAKGHWPSSFQPGLRAGGKARGNMLALVLRSPPTQLLRLRVILMTEAMDPFEKVWEHREEVIYPALFGPKCRGIFVLEAELFREVFRQESFDPRWLHYGVFEFEPTTTRASWVYVSSGASNPWELRPEDYASSEYSGFGTELVFETTAPGNWAIILVQRILAFNILLSHGRYGKDSEPLDYWHRIPYRGPIRLDRSSTLQNLFIAPPAHFPVSFQLASGRVNLLQLVGITDSERDYAKQHGSDKLVDLLIEHEACPVTDPARGPVV